ncbi:hypothetical protein IL992_27915 [Microbispora sp. NEAU-D428]|uniref:hypothetical protein n=1 Tax=Microbispora sitophila TaxID=2771537 RepID=UPI00186965A4|nr:hypothetical protein [Microbispora sitophila]MBE3012981.1 hypothetical protein [Microbispora sitophila]
MSDRTAAAIGYVCGHLADIREHLEALGDTGPLDRLLAAVRSGEEVAGPLDRLHGALVAGGDVLGVYGNAGRGLRALAVEPDPGEFVYLCPQRRCARYRWPSPGSGAAPSCEIGGTPMTRERLR